MIFIYLLLIFSVLHSYTMTLITKVFTIKNDKTEKRPPDSIRFCFFNHVTASCELLYNVHSIHKQ